MKVCGTEVALVALASAVAIIYNFRIPDAAAAAALAEAALELHLV